MKQKDRYALSDFALLLTSTIPKSLTVSNKQAPLVKGDVASQNRAMASLGPRGHGRRDGAACGRAHLGPVRAQA